MTLLIDGYNLLHVSGIFGRGMGPASFARSRTALLRFLASTLDSATRARTTIVFDSQDAPPGLPRAFTVSQMSVRFSTGYADADELLEELIRRDTAPRQLLVVSSDHRVQRAAKRRRAQVVDSDRWYLDQRRARRATASAAADNEDDSAGVLSAEELERWLAEFGDIAEADQEVPSDPTALARPPAATELSPRDGDDLLTLHPAKDGIDVDTFKNPFPPGYANGVSDNELPKGPRRRRS